MLFTIFACVSTGLAMYCILNRVHRKSMEIAVRLAVREVEKDFESRNLAMIAQLNAKEGELVKARQIAKLHETVPTTSRPAPAKPSPPAANDSPTKKVKQGPLTAFEMSRPFTDTAYDALLASSDIVKVEPVAG